MPENAAIVALSAIASPARPERDSKVVSEGSAPLWDWFQPGHALELSAASEEAGRPRPAARASVAAQLVARAQAEGEPVVWIEGGLELYPPDLAAVGVDLEALVVVQPPPSGASGGRAARWPGGSRASARQGVEAVRAAEVLLRSGAFGLVVLDLSREVPKGALTWLARLHGLLRLHGARLLVLTQAGAASLGPLVSLRVAPHCRRLSAERWVIEHEVLKSKLGAQVRVAADVRSAPAGVSGVGVGPRLSKLPAGVEDEQASERCA